DFPNIEQIDRRQVQRSIGRPAGCDDDLRHMTVRHPALDVGLGVHRSRSPSSAVLLSTREKICFPSPLRARWLMQSNQRMMSWRGVAKKRRKRESPKKTVKWSGSVARPQQSWRDGNDRFDHQDLEQDVKWSLYYPCPAAFGPK